MDIDDYYFQSKNVKQRKFEGSSKRKGNTIRFEYVRMNKCFKEIVTKTVREAGAWDTARIDRFCRDVLQDGGNSLIIVQAFLLLLPTLRHIYDAVNYIINVVLK